MVRRFVNNKINLGIWVKINELRGRGSPRSTGEEWREWKNPATTAVNIGGWKTTKKTATGEELMLALPEGTTISANGFFVVARIASDDSAITVVPDLIDENLDLVNRDLQIKIYNGNFATGASLVDVADDGSGRPAAGFVGPFGIFHFSMERNDNPGDGTLAFSWHTCWDDSTEMRGYWKTMPIPFLGSLNRGTPTVRNLSDYDEVAEQAKYVALEEEWVKQQLAAEQNEKNAVDSIAGQSEIGVGKDADIDVTILKEFSVDGEEAIDEVVAVDAGEDLEISDPVEIKAEVLVDNAEVAVIIVEPTPTPPATENTLANEGGASGDGGDAGSGGEE